MVNSGRAACDATILNLINRMARRMFSNGDLEHYERHLLSLPATPSSIPEYYKLERFFDRDEYHSRLQIYLNADAVDAEWDRSAGSRGQLSRITIKDPSQASNILGVELPWNIAAKAIADLGEAAVEGLSIDHIIEGWRHGKAPGGITAEKADQFIDSLRIIKTAKELGGGNQDLLLRRVSAQLFGDSKRIEGLSRQVSFLLGDTQNIEGESIFARLGLVKHPQPMLISGPSSIRIEIEGASVPLVKPYIGLRPDTIKGAQISNTKIQKIITIENLASFNEAAQCESNPDNLMLIYVAGNPTPSLLSAYKRLLISINPTTVSHWGDIDVGGFRIAAQIAENAEMVGRQVGLWHMTPCISTNLNNKANENQISQIASICHQYGWIQELDKLKEQPFFQEQELIEWLPPKNHFLD